MSVYLEAVQVTRDERDTAEAAFRAALREAVEIDERTRRPRHSLREVAEVAGLTKSGVHYLIREER